jgi:hypothetical protein
VKYKYDLSYTHLPYSLGVGGGGGVGGVGGRLWVDLILRFNHNGRFPNQAETMRRPLPVFATEQEVTAQWIYKVKENIHVHCKKICRSVFPIV